QVAMHVSPEAAGMRGTDADELVEVEGRRSREAHLAGSVQAPQLLVRHHRRSARREAQRERWTLAERGGDPSRERARDELRRVENVDIQRGLRGSTHYRYSGSDAPPRASASARRTAPTAGSTVSTPGRLRGATSDSPALTSAASHGTALKMPPASTVGKASPRMPSREITEAAAAMSSLAARSRMPDATASPASWACCPSGASAAMPCCRTFRS